MRLLLPLIALLIIAGCASESLDVGPPAGQILLESANVAPEQQPKSILTLFADANDVLWNQEGSRIFTLSGNALRGWDVVTRAELYAVSHGAHINGAALNSDESLILTWSETSIIVWDAETGERQRELTTSDGQRLKGVVWNSDDNRIYNWQTSQAFLGIWDGETSQNTAIVTIPNETLDPFGNNLVWNDDRTEFLSWGTTDSERGVVRRWQVQPAGGTLELTVVTEYTHDSNTVAGAVWSPDQTRIAAWSLNQVMVWDVATQEEVQNFNVGNFVAGVRWSPDGRYLVVHDVQASDSHVWDVVEGDRILLLNDASNLVWERSSAGLATWVDAIQVWAVPGGQQRVTVETELPPSTVQWHDDGIRMLVLMEGVVQVWVLPRRDRCVIHGLANVRVRNGPGTTFDTVNTLLAHITTEVSAQTVGTDDMRWWKVAEDRWVRSDVVEPTGDCATIPLFELETEARP